MKLVNINLTGFTLMVLIMCLATACQKKIEEREQSSIQGVWSVESIKWVLEDTTYHLANPQPGFLHFSANRYSFIWTPTKDPRVPFENLSNPTPEEMQAGFRSIVLNAGTYAKTDTQITVKAQIAKVPGFEGGEQVFDYSIAGDTLRYTMVDETYPSGEKPSWFGKMKTEFILSKID